MVKILLFSKARNCKACKLQLYFSCELTDNHQQLLRWHFIGSFWPTSDVSRLFPDPRVKLIRNFFCFKVPFNLFLNSFNFCFVCSDVNSNSNLNQILFIVRNGRIFVVNNEA